MQENAFTDLRMFLKCTLIKASTTVVALNKTVLKDRPIILLLVLDIQLLFTTSLTDIHKEIFGACSDLRLIIHDVGLHPSLSINNDSVDI